METPYAQAESACHFPPWPSAPTQTDEDVRRDPGPLRQEENHRDLVCDQVPIPHDGDFPEGHLEVLGHGPEVGRPHTRIHLLPVGPDQGQRVPREAKYIQRTRIPGTGGGFKGFLRSHDANEGSLTNRPQSALEQSKK